jgi:hypothetical protein
MTDSKLFSVPLKPDPLIANELGSEVHDTVIPEAKQQPIGDWIETIVDDQTGD